MISLSDNTLPDSYCSYPIYYCQYLHYQDQLPILPTYSDLTMSTKQNIQVIFHPLNFEKKLCGCLLLPYCTNMEN